MLNLKDTVILFVILTIPFSAPAQEQAAEPYVVPRMEEVPTLDGPSNERAWQHIEPVPLVTHMPSFRQAPSERTEILIAYDDAYLYMAARCYSEPDGIFGPSYERDIFTSGIDYAGITLDTYDDNENGVNFSVTPTGARLDYTIFNDAQGNPPVSVSWNAFWDGAVEQTDEGWFAELRIPFSSLRFQDEEGRARMGLIAFRWISRKAEMVTFPAIEPKWGFWSFAKPSQALDVVFEGIRSRRPLYVTPYALGGFNQEARLNGTETAYDHAGDPTYDLGRDVKYGLTNNLTLDLTINTDFAQVEADDQQVNLTRFPLFFPEKRLFFQERASIFDFGMAEPASVLDYSTFSTSRLFYSRRVGLYNGQPVRILGGARLVGRVGPWDLGFIDMQTARAPNLLEDGGTLPSENLGVLRLRRQVLNEYSYVGFMTTNRLGMDGRYNTAYGADGLFRLFGDDYLSLDWAQTFDDGVGSVGTLERARMQVRWERRTFSGLGYSLTGSRSGAAYDPGLGFLLRSDYLRVGDHLFYGWTPGENSWLQSHQISINGVVFLRNADGSIESVEVGPSWKARMKSGAELYMAGVMTYEDVREAFDLSETSEVPVGSYHFHEMRGRIGTPGGRTLRTTLTASAGSFFDGRRLSAGIQPVWIISRHLKLIGYYGIDRARFKARGQSFTAHLGRLRIRAALNTRVSAAAFVQYSSTRGAVTTNMRFRYNPREGNDLYLVYNHGLNTDRYRRTPTLPMTHRRTVLVKYTHTLNFGI